MTPDRRRIPESRERHVMKEVKGLTSVQFSDDPVRGPLPEYVIQLQRREIPFQIQQKWRFIVVDESGQGLLVAQKLQLPFNGFTIIRPRQYRDIVEPRH